MDTDLTEDIQNFLVTYNTETPYGYSQQPYAGEYSGQHSDQYSDQYSGQYYNEGGYAESEYTAAPTVTSEATTMQSTTPRSCFGGSCVSRPSTHMTTPDDVVVAPPSVVGLHYQNQGAGGSLAPNQVLWCEHSRLLGCPEVFRLDEEHEWIEHHLQHFGGNPPQNVICWFCDTIAFASEHPRDASANFRDRMQHIRGHIFDDHYTSESMRVDFRVIKHLYALGVLSPEAYQHAMSWDETPPQFRLPSERSGSSSSSSSHQPSSQRIRGYAHDLDKERRLERARRKEAKAARTR
ncbi:uncharacterized protein C8A04DRAFT_25709 [Dichotomopilus funicola]|uniref:Uncharacterized protein n=1 Tax=Dichotomopilus funicola TaxID=1934379 RepID=A0AAN6V807_9PEZI|nr:hypothetical protein C8A04DRAFT_25709 [Dichotomopilus funicola]